MEPIVNPGVSCQRQQRGKMSATQPKWRQLCVEYGGLLEIVFFAIKVTFVGYQFLTDFYSHNRCVCSTRSHGPLLCAFCLCFYFKVVLRLSTTFAPVLLHGRIATIVICLHTLRRASTRKLNRFWQNWHLQRWLIVKSKSKMASRPRQRPSTTEKPTMTFSIKPRLICIITKTTVDGASTNIALTIRVAVKCHRQRLFSRDTKWP